MEVNNTPSEKEAPSTEAAEEDWDGLLERVSKAPAAVLEKLITSKEENVKIATRTVRQSDVDKKAKEQAAALAEQTVSELQTQFAGLKTAYDQAMSQLDEQRYATMDETSVELDKTRKAYQVEKRKSEQLEGIVRTVAEKENQAVLLKYAKDHYNLDDDDLDEEVLGADTGPKFMDTLLKKAAKKMEKIAKQAEEEKSTFAKFAEEIESLKRTISGTGTFAATSGGGSNAAGADNVEDIETQLFQNPGNPELLKKYRDAKSRGILK